MLAPPFENVLVLTGPTGSGKTQLALELAQRLDAEIISMDSMAVYRGMDIGTAKPTRTERERIPHHLVDMLDPWQSASVAWWLQEAKQACRQIEAQGKQVLFVGGTPLYLKALLCGLFDGPPANEAIRRQLTQHAELLGSAVLHQRLAEVDPPCAQRIHPNDARRIIRALEVFELTRKPMSAWQTQWPGIGSQESGIRSQESGVLCLELPREELYQRINRRVEIMFAGGWVEEAKQLRALPQPISREAGKALGYHEIFELLDGKKTLKETIEQVQTRSRNFAKRQLTWFRHLPGCQSVSKELTWSLWKPTMKR